MVHVVYSFEYGYKCLSTVRALVVRESDLSLRLAQGKGYYTASADGRLIYCDWQVLHHFGLFPASDSGQRSLLATLSTAA